MNRTLLLITILATTVCSSWAQNYWTPAKQRALTEKLTDAAFNPSWFSECVAKAGGILKVLTATRITVAGPASPPQFHLKGRVVSGNRESCAFGARAPMNWIIEEADNGFRVLGDIGAAESVRILSSTHNGYRDLRIGSTSAAGREFDTALYTFNGTTYVTP